MIHPTHHIFAFTPATLADWCVERDMPKFRAKQILEWVYAKGVIDPAQMTNLSAKDRDTLRREMTFLSGDTVAHQVATDGTQKLLVQWSEDAEPVKPEGASASTAADPLAGTLSRSLPVLNTAGFDYAAGDPGRQTECVMIPAGGGTAQFEYDGDPVTQSKSRRTACISSQVGCAVGCKFCASGLDGLNGNLSAGRIVEQVWRLAQLDGVGRISNVVFMGMGEPLANFKPVTHAVRTIAASWGLGISARKITVSTVGMHKAIEKLADELELPITLALSLHAPNDDLRRQLIPWAEFTSIEDLFRACRRWFEKTGREITLEYIMLGGTNDQPEHAIELAAVAKRLRANVNLIRYNEVAGLEFSRPQTADVRRFEEILREKGVNAHIRASRGRDIAAACGQLRRIKDQASA